MLINVYGTLNGVLDSRLSHIAIDRNGISYWFAEGNRLVRIESRDKTLYELPITTWWPWKHQTPP